MARGVGIFKPSQIQLLSEKSGQILIFLRVIKEIKKPQEGAKVNEPGEKSRGRYRSRSEMSRITLTARFVKPSQSRVTCGLAATGAWGRGRS
jgi:hypothetical protein